MHLFVVGLCGGSLVQIRDALRRVLGARPRKATLARGVTYLLGGLGIVPDLLENTVKCSAVLG